MHYVCSQPTAAPSPDVAAQGAFEADFPIIVGMPSLGIPHPRLAIWPRSPIWGIPRHSIIVDKCSRGDQSLLSVSPNGIDVYFSSSRAASRAGGHAQLMAETYSSNRKRRHLPPTLVALRPPLLMVMHGAPPSRRGRVGIPRGGSHRGIR